MRDRVVSLSVWIDKTFRQLDAMILGRIWFDYVFVESATECDPSHVDIAKRWSYLSCLWFLWVVPWIVGIPSVLPLLQE